MIGNIQIKGDPELFRETSSRDGGLIETPATMELEEFFMSSLKKLEKFIEPILWKIKRRTGNDIEVLDSTAKWQIIDFVENISGQKNIELLDFSDKLIDYIKEQYKEESIPLFKKLKTIAKNSDNLEALEDIDRSEKQYIEELEKRIQAEQQALEEKVKKEEAEKKAREAEEKARNAENKAKEAEAKAKKEKEKREESEEKLESETKQSIFQRALIGTEKKQIIGLQHQIFHSSSRIRRNLKLMVKFLNKEEINPKLEKYISIISLEASKIESITNYVTKANFNVLASELPQDIVQFIDEYISEIYLGDDSIIDSHLEKIVVKYPKNFKHEIEFRPLEITTMVDNFIQNAEKALANKIEFEFKIENNQLVILIQDDGNGIPEDNIPRIFDLGFTTTNGSGIGLHQVNEVIKKLNGTVEVTSIQQQGTKFKITIQQ